MADEPLVAVIKNGKLKGWTSPRYMPRIETVYALQPARVPFDFPEVVAALAPRMIAPVRARGAPVELPAPDRPHRWRSTSNNSSSGPADRSRIRGRWQNRDRAAGM